MPGHEYNTVTGCTSDMTPLKNSDVLSYLMNDNTRFIVRPSGTEPKVKVYLMVQSDTPEACEAVLNRYTEYAENLPQRA